MIWCHMVPFDDKLRCRAVEYVTGGIPALLSSWEHTKGLREAQPDLAADDAVDILAAWAHLQRFVPEHVPRDVRESISTIVDQDGALMAGLIGEALDPSGWLEAAEALENATDETFCDVPAISSAALELFCQLDTADLAIWAAERLGQGDKVSELREEIGRCWGCFLMMSGIFAPAAGYAKAMLHAHRPDLLAFDGELFTITEKYTLLADEDVLVPFGHEEVTAITEEQYARFCEVLLQRRRPIISAWPEVRDRVAIAAETKSEGGMFGGQRVEFAAEDGSWHAWMGIPASVLDANELLSLWIRDRSGIPIGEGEVVLYGESFPISDGRALIPLSELRRLQDMQKGPSRSDTIRVVRNGRQSIGKVVKPERKHGDDQS